ncbi:MAG: SMC-Scp complex subunit ScpB [Defluviitaleaceae bacterium]|nr:SMC-Scp complex subunit ScpB [Defluviitaleaceae bacterium]
MNIDKYENALEAILFASGESVELSKLAYCLELDERDIKPIITNLIDKYENENRGIKIIQINDAYQMCTNEDYFEFVSRLIKAPAKKQLSPALLETLAIIAYKQPVTKAMIEEIRGVDAYHAVNKLMEFKLICESGRLDAPGKPLLFSTSEEFLKYFGLKNLRELPNLPDISLEDLEGEYPEGIY